METTTVGRPPKPQRTPFLVRMPPKLHQELRIYSTERGEVLSEVIVEIIEAWWVQQPEQRAIARKARKARTEAAKAKAKTKTKPKKGA